jgi:phosphomannomutase
VVADTGNGTVGHILERVYRQLPVNFVGLYLDPDGSLPDHVALIHSNPKIVPT